MRISDWSSDGCSSDLDETMFSLWYRLLKELELRCAARGETAGEGRPLKFVVEDKTRTTLYPLHSLRVSLLTCLAVDAEVPLVVLAKLEIGRASCRERCVSTCESRWSQKPYKKN